MIKWAKKVPQELISKLYNQSISGLDNDELANEVGWALFARCESIISVTNGVEEKFIICPECGKNIDLKDEVFACICGFQATLKQFKSSYKKRQLHAANALPIFVAFHKNFPKAKSYGEKLICIDVLIHSFHIKSSYYKTLDSYDPENESVALNRPTCANLIEGSLPDVILFLDNLSEINTYPSEKKRWQSIVKRSLGGQILK